VSAMQVDDPGERIMISCRSSRSVSLSDEPDAA
jgi:hypothetical protein